MAFVVKNLVQETSTTEGTGTYSLAGATADHVGFVAGIGDNNTCPYTARMGSIVEAGIGTVDDASPDTLARTTVLSVGGAVDWAAGTKTISCGLPAELAVMATRAGLTDLDWLQYDAASGLFVPKTTAALRALIQPAFDGHPDIPPASPNTEDDEFDAGSLDGKWTNVGTATLAFASSRMIVAFLSASAADFRQAYAPGASVAFSIRAKFTGLTFIEATDYIGLVVLDSGNAQIAASDYRYDANMRWNKDAPGGSANVVVVNRQDTIYLEIKRDASDNYLWGFSYDGLQWSYPMVSASSSTTVAKIGFRFGQTASATYKRGSIDWFRRT